jgi:hypothetical protein
VNCTLRSRSRCSIAWTSSSAPSAVCTSEIPSCALRCAAASPPACAAIRSLIASPAASSAALLIRSPDDSRRIETEAAALDATSCRCTERASVLSWIRRLIPWDSAPAGAP